MAVYMRENLRIGRDLGLVGTYMLMGLTMKVNGWLGREMEQASRLDLKELLRRDFLKTTYFSTQKKCNRS